MICGFYATKKARIDAPGALHHIIVRGIERRRIFSDDQDRDNFIERFGNILIETQTYCFALALISNHDHILLRTGQPPPCHDYETATNRLCSFRP